MLTFCTGNKHKFEEVQAELGRELTQYKDGYPEVQADSLEFVVGTGMDHLDPLIDGPYFVDDSGIFIDSLNGFPGVYSAYVHNTIGNDGILRLMDGISDRKAVFRCVIGYRDADGKRHLLVGESKGTIAELKTGDAGFGYDPIFIPEGKKITFAQMDQTEKNQFSPRGKAVRKLKDM